MRNPLKEGLIWLAVFAGGALLALAAFLWLGNRGNFWVGVALFLVGFLMLIISPLAALQGLLGARGRARLVAGTEVIARWHVDVAEWERFRAFDAGRALAGLPSEVRFAQNGHARGVDIVVGWKSVLVDGSYHPLRRWAVPELQGIDWLANPSGPSVLEFTLLYASRSGGTRVGVRLPVPDAAEADARRVYDHYAGKIPPPRPAPIIGLKPRTAATILGVGSAVSLVSFAVGWSLKRGGNEGLTPVLLMMAGITVLFCLAFLGIIYALVQRDMRRAQNAPPLP